MISRLRRLEIALELLGEQVRVAVDSGLIQPMLTADQRIGVAKPSELGLKAADVPAYLASVRG